MPDWCFDPLHRVAKLDPQLLAAWMIVQCNRIRADCAYVCRNDAALIVRKSKVQRGPEIAAFNVRHGDETGLFKMTDKTANWQIVDAKLEIVQLANGRFQRLNIVNRQRVGAQGLGVLVLEKFDIVQRVSHAITVQHFAQGQRPMLNLFWAAYGQFVVVVRLVWVEIGANFVDEDLDRIAGLVDGGVEYSC